MGIRAKPRRYRYGLKRKPSELSFSSRYLTPILSSILVLGAVTYLAMWCWEPAHFPILSVKFIGERNYLTQAELQKAVLPQIKSGFFRLTVSTLQQQLLLLPWVKQVNLRKVWPNALIVDFEEHTPAAFWGDQGVMSTTGTLFYPDFSRLSHVNVPRFKGAEGKSALIWQHYLAMKQILMPIELTITDLVLAPRGAWHLKLSSGMTIILGTNDVLMRLQRFVCAYQKKLHTQSEKIAYIDLRYTSGLAVCWKSS